LAPGRYDEFALTSYSWGTIDFNIQQRRGVAQCPVRGRER
jgi:hypothetical protein